MQDMLPKLLSKAYVQWAQHCHGIKFQSIVTPDGLFASMYGPVNGNRYDRSEERRVGKEC